MLYTKTGKLIEMVNEFSNTRECGTIIGISRNKNNEICYTVKWQNEIISQIKTSEVTSWQ
jgi:hypothetical protein